MVWLILLLLLLLAVREERVGRQVVRAEMIGRAIEPPRRRSRAEGGQANEKAP